jgi:hypothetical protein
VVVVAAARMPLRCAGAWLLWLLAFVLELDEIIIYRL